MAATAQAAPKKKITFKDILNWILDHAMIIIIALLAIYVQIQRPAFFGPANLISLLQFTTARLPMALGVAGCIILAGTDLSGGRIAGLCGYLAAVMGLSVFPNQPVLALLICMLAGGLIGLVNGFCMGKFKLHPFIVTLATQQITYGVYLTLSNSAQLSMPESYAANFATSTLFSIQTGVCANGTPILTKVSLFVLLAIILTCSPSAPTRRPPVFPASACCGPSSACSSWPAPCTATPASWKPAASAPPRPPWA